MKSDVYLIKVASSDIENRITALKKLLHAISPFSVYAKNELVPVKLTIGDSSCVYNVSPELVKVVVSEIKKKQAKPFLFDTSVIYHGERQNALDHLNLAQYKGFSHSKVGAPFLIADGLLGQDGKEFEIGSKYLKKIKVPSFIGMLDSLVVLTHATGHILSIYAGALKNVAMGMSSRSTKQMQHSSLKPKVTAKKCNSCDCCLIACPAQAITHKDGKAFINEEMCIGCSECLCACKFDAIGVNWHEDVDVFCKRMVEVAGCILAQFKHKFFITFALDITKECDCISDKNEKMAASDIGILASRDIVSLDKATADLVGEDKKAHYLQKSKGVYEKMFAYAAENGLGNLEYNLITL
ncbi:MAG: hypothetical protein A2Y00_10435 [Omnitrophica WOR_2 bacterium GWF2_43_52]|nr:MAG: hypothetical protein A2Y01_06525 [Omnitrophica WOR_2 bacterium GWC2_44_8]OGX21884.1 MAG: hypothetical protein A2Y00_10435 [Omnitrophica WOR_2 bacterium GWF2_43_52]OGX56990.1 MAG: hypothetical protein A2460_08230 [Omnitrophica WOR_2 bacterium RIFOXYC2_FULL_43_9]HAH20179.1 hypothetical protein [Candidatus Omnitrophota bacterium]HBG63041.1 hypothetical protein [Candidatus Omnitrophota bacterium]